jgi:hypothetical protein
LELDLHREIPLPPQPRPRPLFVIVIGCFYLARAALLLLASVGPLRSYRVDPVPFSAVQVITLNVFSFVIPYNENPFHSGSTPDVTEQKLDTAMALIVFVPVAVLSAYVGFALLFWRRSGRTLAVIWALFTVLFWLRGILLSSAFHDLHQTLFTSPKAKSNIILALFFNGFIFFYLVYGNDVAHAFGEKE